MNEKNCRASWARICKRLRITGIDSEESILPAYVAWQAGTKNRVFVPARRAGNLFLGSLKGLQIWAQFVITDQMSLISPLNSNDRSIPLINNKFVQKTKTGGLRETKLNPNTGIP